LSFEQKNALFSVLFRIGMGLDDQALATDLAKLPEVALEEILALAGERIQ
jgi:ribosomal protein L12E/L44/L45/RPP1/RPP2